MRSLALALLVWGMLCHAASGVMAQEATTPTGAPGKEADSAAHLAKQLSNPVASLISVPFQSNWDFGIGPKNATRYTMNLQPVIPFELGKDWNLITRTIVPVINQESSAPGLHDEFGFGDVLQSFFFSPRRPVGGWIVGLGPVFAYPTASHDALGSGKWGAGPTAVLVKQRGPWTVGVLANHVHSIGGHGNRADVSTTLIQPFLTHNWKTGTGVTLNTESTYDWENHQWTVPINLAVSQVLKVGKQPLSVGLGGRYYAKAPDGGPDWGLRFTVTLMFPKR